MLLLALNVVHTKAFAETGIASYYGGDDGLHGSLTASGERFNQNAFTCAHKTRKLGSTVAVSFQGKTVDCRINDRGPFTKGRVIDLSVAVAKALGLYGIGIGIVEIR